ncbi:ATP-binding protein [Ekhidna sp.]|uniref:sensor histidine kinase n=1 Tax=Ekhidna sp. TaxID=2608089 RepID=UPI003298407A
MTDGFNKSGDQIALLEKLPDAVLLVKRNGQIQFANQSASRLFGWSGQDVLARSVDKILPIKSRKNIRQILDDFYERADDDFVEKIDLIALKQDDSEFPVNVSIVYLPSSKDLVLLNIRDISTQTRAENELVRKNHLLNFAEEIVSIGHWQWDLVTNDVIWSDNLFKIFGRDDKGVLNYDTYFSYVHPDDVAFVSERVQSIIADKKFYHFYHKILREDGEVKLIHLKGKVFKNEEGEVIEMIGTCQDVTEREKNEKLMRRVSILEAKSKEMEQFAYIASHDLRHPLLTIINYIKAFDEDFGNEVPKEAMNYLNAISNSANRMNKLIKGLLGYARLSSKKERVKVDCNKLVKAVLKDIDSTIKRTGAKVQVGELPVLEGYEIELHQLFQNLLVNALKFKKPNVKPEIEISAKTLAPDSYSFAVKDNGIGIAKKYDEKIFVIFKRLHDESKFEGTGIGLANCKKIVEIHHGTIWVESKLGEGSVFHFTINPE